MLRNVRIFLILPKYKNRLKCQYCDRRALYELEIRIDRNPLNNKIVFGCVDHFEKLESIKTIEDI